jgi:putative ABC transport system permease protein
MAMPACEHRVSSGDLSKAVGMARRQVRQIVRWEALITAVFGAVLGLGTIGFGVAPLPPTPAGQFLPSGGQLAIWLVIAAVAGLVTSIGPARKATRLNVLEAISYE